LSNSSVVKACINENKKDTKYCCNKIPGRDIDCCLLGQDVEFWHFDNMDVHGTAFIMKDGRISKIPVTSNGKHVFCSMIGALRLNVDR